MHAPLRIEHKTLILKIGLYIYIDKSKRTSLATGTCTMKTKIYKNHVLTYFLWVIYRKQLVQNLLIDMQMLDEVFRILFL